MHFLTLDKKVLKAFRPHVKLWIQAYHPSGFKVYCSGGRRDLKSDYRMSGFGPID